MPPVPVPVATARGLVPLLATALCVHGAAVVSAGLAFGQGALLLLWLPTSVAMVAVLAGGRRHLVAAAIGIAAWAARDGAPATAWAVGACTVAPLAAAAAFDAWGRARPTSSQFLTTVRLQVVLAFVLAPIAALFDLRSGLLAPSLGAGAAGARFAEAYVVEAMSAAVAVRALMSLLPDRAGGYCPIEVARTGRTGLTRMEWAAWAAMVAAFGAAELAAAAGRSGTGRLALVLGFAVAVLASLIGNRRNTSSMLLVATVATLFLRARVEPFSEDPGYLTNLAQHALLTWLGAVMAHLLNATSAERIAQAARLRELAMTDAESGLPNLRAFRERLEADRRDRAPVGAQLVEVRVPDVERWAELAGRAAAIRTERSAGLALRAAFDEGFVAHVGSGRYALLLPGRTDDAVLRARIHGAIDLQRLEAGSEQGLMRSFVGVLDLPAGEPADAPHDADSLLAALSIAQHRSHREAERFHRVALSASLLDAHRAGLRSMRAVRDAVQAGRVRLLAQPIAPADGDRARLHYEVLARLVDDDGREIAPATFLPMLSQLGQLQAFDRLVVARVLDRLATDAALRDCTATCAINLTGPTLADARFPAFLAERLAATGVEAGRIKLEITESDRITSLEGAMHNTAALVRGGVSFALDDFGTGLATFDYLRRFAPAWVKIDGSFVRAVDDGPLARQIVDSIVRVAHAAGAATVAECVETSAIAARMRELGVDYLQGWWIARPMPMEALLAYRRHGAAPAPDAAAGAAPELAAPLGREAPG